jgi:signal transduction histidine kinase
MADPQKLPMVGGDSRARDAGGAEGPSGGTAAAGGDPGPMFEAWALFDAVPDLVALIVDNIVRYINHSGAAMVGAEAPSAVVGLRVDSIFEPKALHAMLLQWQKGRQQDASGWHRSRIVCLDGKEVGADIRVVPLTAQKALGVVARRADLPVVLADGSATTHAVEGVKQLVTNLAHELRTPLNAIIGFSDVIAQQMFGEINDRYQGYAGDIKESGQHLLRVINDILDYAKLDAGQMVLRPQRERLDEIVRAGLRLVAGQAERAGVVLVDQVPDDGQLAFVDRTKIKQVLINLLSNAIRFTPRGGRVSVSLKPADHDMIRVCVSDTGVGMSEAELADAMLPFRQPKLLRDGRLIGAGLGLPIAKALIALHRGELHIKSVPQQGTVVQVTLPIEAEPRAAAD